MNDRELKLNMIVAGDICVQIQKRIPALRIVMERMENPCALPHELQRLALAIDNLTEAVQDPSFWRFGPEETEEEA